MSASGDRVREILEERARQLARPLAAAGPVDTLELLTFSLGEERCGVESRFVHAVLRVGAMTPLPGAVPPLAGVTGWRGEVLTLLDLRSVLGMAGGAVEALVHALVLGRERPAFGVLVSELGSVCTVAPADVRPLPEGKGGARDLLAGATGDALLVLRADRLIARQTERGQPEDESR